jgi:hypothetical protein
MMFKEIILLILRIIRSQKYKMHELVTSNAGGTYGRRDSNVWPAYGYQNQLAQQF